MPPSKLRSTSARFNGPFCHQPIPRGAQGAQGGGRGGGVGGEGRVVGDGRRSRRRGAAGGPALEPGDQALDAGAGLRRRARLERVDVHAGRAQASLRRQVWIVEQVMT